MLYRTSTITKVQWFGMVKYDMRHLLIFKGNPPVHFDLDQSIQETICSNNLIEGKENIKGIPSAEYTPSGTKKDMEEDKESIVYKTKYDRRFKNIVFEILAIFIILAFFSSWISCF